jgi:drug/metabolite transporter (DMT)-like permease
MLYAFSAILLKRCLADGVDSWAVVVWSNLMMGAVFLSLFFFSEQPPTLVHATTAFFPAVGFFVGQIFTFLALAKGDASVATPVLSTKIILVALFTVVLLSEPIAPTIWIAAFLATGAIALIQRGRKGLHQRVGFTIFLGLISASGFALCDVLIQRDAPALNAFAFLPFIFGWVAVFSLFLAFIVRRRLFRIPPGVRWIFPGAIVLLGIQCVAMGLALGLFGRATEVNIVYSTRGIWTVVMIWTIGPWLGNLEREQGVDVMRNRLMGSALLLLAIFLVLV